MKSRSVIFVPARKLTSLVVLVFFNVHLATTGAAKAAQEPGPDELYHQAWQIIKHNYADKSFNGQVWESWEDRYSGKLKTEEDAYLAIETMVASLGYPHEGLVPRTPIQSSATEQSAAREPSDVVSAKLPSKSGLPSLGYIRFKAFKSQNCDRDLNRAIIDLQSCDGLILDLRNNEGEVLSVATNCLLPFFSQMRYIKSVTSGQTILNDKSEILGCPIVFYRFDNSDEVYKLGSLSNVFFNKPLVVLVNHETAAAAVMFAAALKENGRATVVGTTANKGSKVIETVYHLKDGTTLKIPTARWFSPSHNDFSSIEFQPDVELKLSAKDKRSGKGAWWKRSTTSTKFTDASTTNQDLQLLKSEEVLNDLVRQPNSLPAYVEKTAH
jgi:C-terminal processing protease CtpA/Prc